MVRISLDASRRHMRGQSWFPVDLIDAMAMCGLDPRIHHARNIDAKKTNRGPSPRVAGGG